MTMKLQQTQSSIAHPVMLNRNPESFLTKAARWSSASDIIGPLPLPPPAANPFPAIHEDTRVARKLMLDLLDRLFSIVRVKVTSP